jgi:hypothetical protein
MIKRVALILKRAVEEILKIPGNTKEFGVHAALWLWFLAVLPSKKGPRYIRFLTKYMDDYLKPLTKRFIEGSYDADAHIPDDHVRVNKNPVWVCWLQGEEYMPELVQMCYRQLKKNVPSDSEIHLITLENYSRYVTLPDYVVKKFKEGKISPAHFSDVLRFTLLSKYGGLWVDSTVFVSGKIPEKYLNSDFYTQKVKDVNKYNLEPSRAQWCGFIFGGKKNNILYCFVREALFKYWKDYDKAIDYIFFDYIILNAYNNIAEIRFMIDNQQANNEEIWSLWQNINSVYDKDLYNSICAKNIFHKLSYKGDLVKITESGEQTMYGYLLEQQKLQ